MDRRERHLVRVRVGDGEAELVVEVRGSPEDVAALRGAIYELIARYRREKAAMDAAQRPCAGCGDR